MSRMPRNELIDEDEPGVYHCVSRCVRRAHLCGKDPLTGNNCEHRKDWIRDRLELLASIFAIDAGGYSVMSSHLHQMLRNRPDIVRQWSDQEVARRWWKLHPKRRKRDGTAAKPRRRELDLLMADEDKLLSYRRRLSSISWWMKCLCEKIGRMANKEDRCTGRFWEGRYRCQKLLDDAAILACAIYVDLNPIRAGIAKTPETSQYTSAFDRIHDLLARVRNPSVKPVSQSGVATRTNRSGWLIPIQLREGQGRSASRRASNKGLLPISLTKYLALLDWTGRQIRRGKRGAIPPEVAPILERLQIPSSGWVDLIEDFGKRFHRAVGRRSSLVQEAKRRGLNWIRGVGMAKASFG